MRRKRKNGERKREKKEDLVVSSSDFQRSNGRSSLGSRVKVHLLNKGYAPRGRDFPTLVDFLPFWTSVQRDRLGTVILN